MKRKIGLFLIFAAALPLAATSIAWACASLATAKLDKTVAAPGEAVTLTGRNYSTAAGASAVTIRLNTRAGRTLGGAIAPDPSGRISSTFNLPADLSPGYYVINVLQFNANGTPKSGTPGRAADGPDGVEVPHGVAAAAAAVPCRRIVARPGVPAFGLPLTVCSTLTT